MPKSKQNTLSSKLNKIILCTLRTNILSLRLVYKISYGIEMRYRGPAQCGKIHTI
jgi:hypothetical protein